MSILNNICIYIEYRVGQFHYIYFALFLEKIIFFFFWKSFISKSLLGNKNELWINSLKGIIAAHPYTNISMACECCLHCRTKMAGSIPLPLPVPGCMLHLDLQQVVLLELFTVWQCLCFPIFLQGNWQNKYKLKEKNLENYSKVFFSSFSTLPGIMSCYVSFFSLRVFNKKSNIERKCVF